MRWREPPGSNCAAKESLMTNWPLAYPGNWQRLPEEALAERETLDVVLSTIQQLPPPQRLVITMRDIQGCDAAEVCEVLDVSEGNQRVLLHRARSKVRSALERQLDG